MATHQANPSPTVPDISWKWEAANYNEPWHESIVNLMVRHVPKGSTVLEVGAGGSHTLASLSSRNDCACFGIEPDRSGIFKTLQFGKEEKGDVNLIQGNGFHLPLADNSFNVVYSLGLIEHFDSDQSEELLVEHIRACRPGGKVIIGVPNFLNFPHTIRKFIKGKRYEYYPERSYSPQSLISLMKKQNLVDIKVDGMAPLWGIGMFKSGWRVLAVLNRLGLSHRLNNLQSPFWRSALGYMTYAIGTKIS